jgi:hypothetical protein
MLRRWIGTLTMAGNELRMLAHDIGKVAAVATSFTPEHLDNDEPDW